MIELKNVTKTFKSGNFELKALDQVSLSFRQNEFVAVVGESGSGKTTLLNVLGGLLSYDSGEMLVRGKSTQDFSKTDWDAYRNNSVGFIFQNYQLIPHLSILKNVEMGLTLSGVGKQEKEDRSKVLLDRVGLLDHIHKKPNQLSGGQMQRVAIARALANDPDIILADEPTGALDSETSQEILDLLTEISKDKLIVMVTHSQKQAETYANRIIQFADGRIIDDSQPYDGLSSDDDYQLNRTGMSFWNALNLSWQNIMTKKARTAITSVAASIGIFGVAAVLALSNGLNLQIENFERESLAQYPLTIEEETVSIEAAMDQQGDLNDRGGDLDAYSNSSQIIPNSFIEELDSLGVKNNISQDFLDYAQSIPNEYVQAFSLQRPADLHLLTEKEGEIIEINPDQARSQEMPVAASGESQSYVASQYDLLQGEWPVDGLGLILVVDEYNQVDTTVLDALGLPYEEDQPLDFDQIIGKDFRLTYNDSYYQKEGDLYQVPSNQENLDAIYNNDDNLALEITGIIRPKESSNIQEPLGSLMVPDAVKQDYIDNAQSSQIVQDQQEADVHLVTGQPFASDEEMAAQGAGAEAGMEMEIQMQTPSQAQTGQSSMTTKEDWLAELGAETLPSGLAIYPASFEAKSEVLDYFDQWNQEVEEEDQITVTDMAALITELSGGLMNAITMVLVAFASISLVVSMVMIGIIIYTSVLERSQEIGILRALGAREKDISRVFNAETLIIGLSSGLIGVVGAYLLTIPVNAVIYNMTDLEGVAQLDPLHAIILIIISVILTLIGGLIPSRIAAKKDPVEALSGE